MRLRKKIVDIFNIKLLCGIMPTVRRTFCIDIPNYISQISKAFDVIFFILYIHGILIIVKFQLMLREGQYHVLHDGSGQKMKQ